MRTTDAGTSVRWLLGLTLRAPSVVRSGGLGPADRFVRGHEVRVKVPSGQVALIPGDAFGSTRELYCRNVYLREGLEVRPQTWVIDLGANAGMFTNLAAVQGAHVVAVEAQAGFLAEIRDLARRNRTEDRVHVVNALIGPNDPALGITGMLSSAEEWEDASHAAAERPDVLGMDELLRRFEIDRVSLLKIDIEGGEFALITERDDLGWLDRVDQLTMEVHPEFGDVDELVRICRERGFSLVCTDNDGALVEPGDPLVNYVYGVRDQDGAGDAVAGAANTVSR